VFLFIQIFPVVLLQVAKLVKSDEIGFSGRKKVFKAVGFSFINRLLATGNAILFNTYHA